MHKKTPGFALTSHSGFHITFENLVTVSVQFGPGSYSENYELINHVSRSTNILEMFDAAGQNGCQNAEIALIGKDGEWLTKLFKDEGDDVLGYQTPLQVMDALVWASHYEYPHKKLRKKITTPKERNE